MKRLLITLILLSIAATAQADLRGVFEMPGQATMTVYYKDDNNIRIETEDEGFVLVTEDSVYTVISQHGRQIAIDMAEMGRMMEQHNQDPLQEEDPAPTDIRRTDRTETVAGYEGRVHTVTVEGETLEIVLSDDDEVIELTRGFLTAINRMGQSVSPEADMDLEDMLEQIRDTGYPGILKQDNGMVLQSLRNVDQPASFYRLPDGVDVMDMQGMPSAPPGGQQAPQGFQ